ncbi:MAG: MFS transporter [Proteobacteria bacterium]|nr:MFS transporter [Pseudomonadota bacterium]
MKYRLNFSILKENKNFRLIFTGRFVSTVGTMITGVALPYQVYHETQSTLLVGLVSLFQLLPLLLTALLGGAFADRFDRRRIMITTGMLLGLGSLLLALNTFLAHPSVVFIFVIAAFMSACFGFNRPAMEGITQQIVAKEDYGRAAALSNLMMNTALVLGPAIAGVLIAQYGVVITYFIDFATYLFALGAVLKLVQLPASPKKRDKTTIALLGEGFRYAFSRQELVGTYFVDFIAMIFGMPVALFPAVAQQHGGPRVLGILYATPAVGAVIISLYSGWTNHIKRQGVAIAIAASLWGLAIILFGLLLKVNFWVALIFLAAAGGSDAVSGIFRATLWNQTIPMELRGRLSGIEMISYLSGPKLGDTEAGIIAALFGVITSIVSGGVLCIVGVAVCCYYLPRFWNYHSASNSR